MEPQKKIILLVHCLLNSHAKVAGSARPQNAHAKLLHLLVQKEYGIIQLPCPEMTALGSRRWGQINDQIAEEYAIDGGKFTF